MSVPSTAVAAARSDELSTASVLLGIVIGIHETLTGVWSKSGTR